MANSDPDSHEAGKKKKLDNTDGKSVSTSPRSAIWNSSKLGKTRGNSPSAVFFLPFFRLSRLKLREPGKGRRLICSIRCLQYFWELGFWNLE